MKVFIIVIFVFANTITFTNNTYYRNVKAASGTYYISDKIEEKEGGGVYVRDCTNSYTVSINIDDGISSDYKFFINGGYLYYRACNTTKSIENGIYIRAKSTWAPSKSCTANSYFSAFLHQSVVDDGETIYKRTAYASFITPPSGSKSIEYKIQDSNGEWCDFPHSIGKIKIDKYIRNGKVNIKAICKGTYTYRVKLYADIYNMGTTKKDEIVRTGSTSNISRNISLDTGLSSKILEAHHMGAQMYLKANYLPPGTTIKFNGTNVYTVKDNDSINTTGAYIDTGKLEKSIIDVTATEPILNESLFTKITLKVGATLNSTPTMSANINVNQSTNNINISGTVMDGDIGDSLKLMYRIDGSNGNGGSQMGSAIVANGSHQSFNRNINISNLSQGNHTFYTWVEDNGGAKSNEISKSFSIDNSPPKVTASNIDYNNWNKSIDVNLTFSDANGIRLKQYELSTNKETSGNYKDYTNTITIDNESNSNYIHYKSIDNVENEVKGSFGPYKIDKSGPIITFQRLSEKTLRVISEDLGSGISSLVSPKETIDIDGENNYIYNYEINGEKNVQFTSSDKLNNTSVKKYSIMPAKINISGDDIITIETDTNGSVTKDYLVTVLDTDNFILDNETVAWEIKNNPKGVSVDDKGNVTVTKEVTEAIISLQAISDSDNNILGSKNIKINKVTPPLLEISLDTPKDKWTKLNYIVGTLSNGKSFSTVLPDNSTTNKNIFTYKVTKNGMYKFKSINEYNKSIEKTIEITNIDNIAPKATITKNSNKLKFMYTDNESGVSQVYILNANGERTNLDINKNEYELEINNSGTYSIVVLDKLMNCYIKLIDVTIPTSNTSSTSSSSHKSNHKHSSKDKYEIKKEEDSNKLKLNKSSGFNVIKSFSTSNLTKSGEWLHISDNINIPYKNLIALQLTEDDNFVPIPMRLNDGKVEILTDKEGFVLLIERNKTFDDIKNHWAKEDIELMANKMIVSGKTDEKFYPNDSITRAEFIAVMTRALYKNDFIKKNVFIDVSIDAWYNEYCNTAYDLGLINGNNNKFYPKNNITREEMAVIIYRALELHNLNISTETKNITFKDVDKINKWAEDAIYSLVNNGMIYGRGDKYDPKANLTRAEGVVIVERLMKKLGYL
jgi:hypothetical protein